MTRRSFAGSTTSWSPPGATWSIGSSPLPPTISTARCPTPIELTGDDQALLSNVDQALETVAGHIEAVELRAGLRAAMEAASEVNVYLNANAPWKMVKENPKRAETILWTAIQAISGIRVALSPYLPFTTPKVGEMLGLSGAVESWERPGCRPGPPWATVEPLFVKLEDRRPGLSETPGRPSGVESG